MSDTLPTDMATANALGDDYGWPVMFLVLIFVAGSDILNVRLIRAPTFLAVFGT